MPPLDTLRAQYQTLDATITASIRRLGLKNAQRAQEALVLQGAYLFGVRAFEAFLEARIVSLCATDASWGPKQVGGTQKRFVQKVVEDNPRRVKALLAMGRSYGDYLPIEKTIEKAEVLFAAGRPFTLLDREHKDVIKRAHVVRNFIAHDSSYSRRSFVKVVCSRYRLRADQQTAEADLMYEAQRGLPLSKQDLASLIDVASFLS